MRISDWSSDVCSSDLHLRRLRRHVWLSRSRAAPRPLGHSRLCAGIAKGGTREGATMSARRLIGAGLLLACCALALMIIAPAEALRGWLGALFLWSGVPLGALGLILSIRIIGGRWGPRLLPSFEAQTVRLS